MAAARPRRGVSRRAAWCWLAWHAVDAGLLAAGGSDAHRGGHAGWAALLFSLAGSVAGFSVAVLWPTCSRP